MVKQNAVRSVSSPATAIGKKPTVKKEIPPIVVDNGDYITINLPKLCDKAGKYSLSKQEKSRIVISTRGFYISDVEIDGELLKIAVNGVISK